ncbi:MAG: hypothetical protein V4577_24605 [Bacteroidota bacterium]
MKILTKIFMAAFFAAALLFTTAVNAQNTPANTFGLNLGLESGLTTGHIQSSSNAYAGATATLQYGLSKNFALTLTSGYYEFFPKAYRSAMGMVPVKLGLKYFVTPHFYLFGEAGAGIELQKYNEITGLQDGTPPGTRFLFSTGVGYTVNSWDFNLRYENFSGPNKAVPGVPNGYGLVGLHTAYKLKL